MKMKKKMKTNSNKNEEKDLNILKEIESKRREYKKKEKVVEEDLEDNYKSFAYKVKNPFKGV